MKKMTLTQMKKANKAIGHEYFSKGTMEFWNSRIEVQPNQYNLFIESAQPEDDETSALYVPRQYFVKYFNSENSEIVSITHFDDPKELIKTLEAAMKVKSAITKAFTGMGNREKWIMDNLSTVEYTPDWLTFIAYDGDETRKFDVSYDGRICG